VEFYVRTNLKIIRIRASYIGFRYELGLYALYHVGDILIANCYFKTVKNLIEGSFLNKLKALSF
jgi:hypothetical protein